MIENESVLHLWRSQKKSVAHRPTGGSFAEGSMVSGVLVRLGVNRFEDYPRESGESWMTLVFALTTCRPYVLVPDH